RDDPRRLLERVRTRGLGRARRSLVARVRADSPTGGRPPRHRAPPARRIRRRARAAPPLRGRTPARRPDGLRPGGGPPSRARGGFRPPPREADLAGGPLEAPRAPGGDARPSRLPPMTAGPFLAPRASYRTRSEILSFALAAPSGRTLPVGLTRLTSA